MIQSPEDRIAQLEKLVKDLSARVNRLEYSNMRFGNQQMPVTSNEQPQMGYAQ